MPNRPKISKLKSLLSQLFEITLERTHSSINGNISVKLDRGKLKLVAQKAVYSYEDRYTCFRDFFLKFNIQEYPIKTCLSLGYGLGSVPLMLDRIIPDIHHTAVEIDEAVISLTKKYGYIPNHFQLHLADAEKFMENPNTKFDLIAVDLFIDAIVPAKFETVEFLASCNRALSENGMLLINRVAFPEAALEKTEIYFEEVFNRFFQDAGMFSTRGNRMLWAFENP